MSWKPSRRDYSEEITNDIFARIDPSDFSIKSKDTIYSVKDKNIIDSDRINSPSETMNWSIICDEITRDKNRFTVTLENKRRGIDDNMFIKSDINIPLPKLHKRMEAQIYKNHLNGTHTGSWPVDLSLLILQEHLQDSKNLMHENWVANMRSNSLETLTKCLDLMQSFHPLKFYSSIFVEIVNILDDFCNLVIKRIKDSRNTLLDAPESDDKSLCLNWIIKVGSTCSLVPRLYLLFAFIPIQNYYHLLDKEKLLFEASQIRGIGNVMTATYLRMFFIKCCALHAPDCLSSVSKVFLEDITKSLVNGGWEKDMIKLDSTLTYSDCCDIIAPSLKFIMHYALVEAKEKSLLELMKRVASMNSPSILCAAIKCLPTSFVAKRSLEFFGYITQYQNKRFSTSKLFSAFGESLVKSDIELTDIQILNNCWNIIRKYENLEDYMLCVPSWLSYCIKYYPLNITDAMLDDIIKHINQESFIGYLDPSDILQITNILFLKTKNIDDLFNLTNFIPFLQNIRDPITVVQSCYTLFTSQLIKDHKEITDINHINILIDIFNLCNENYRKSFDCKGLDNFEKKIGYILEKFLPNTNFEEYINIFILVRSNLYRFEDTYHILINKVINIIIKEDEIFYHHQQNGSTDKLYTCLAFCLVTILSIINTYRGMQLTIYCAQISMRYGCIGHAYSFLELIVCQLEELNLDINEKEISSVISSFLSTILLIPDHPEKETLYFVRKAISIIDNFSNNTNDVWKATQLSNVVSILNAYSQKSYIYELDNCKSNNQLYMGSPKFNSYVANMTEEAIARIDNYLFNKTNKIEDSGLITSISRRIMLCIDINDEVCLNFISKLQNIKLIDI